MGEITLTDAIGEPVATLPTKGFEYDEENKVQGVGQLL